MLIAFKDISVRLRPDRRMSRIFEALVVTAPTLFDDTVVITSALDGRHKTHSLHYVGLALDVRFTGQRTGGIAGEVGGPGQTLLAMSWVERLVQWLGPDYDVVLESDHIHIEWDPE